MKKVINYQVRAGLAVTILIAALSLDGCAMFGTKGDQVVVNAEKTTAIAADTFDLFLKIDAKNKEVIKTNLPDAHKYAEYLRAKVDDGTGTGATIQRGIKWLKDARRLTAAYKNNRTEDNKVSLNTIIVTLTTAIDTSKDYITRSGLKAP